MNYELIWLIAKEKGSRVRGGKGSSWLMAHSKRKGFKGSREKMQLMAHSSWQKRKQVAFLKFL